MPKETQIQIDDWPSLRAKINAAREARNETLEALATRIGSDRTSVSYWLSGAREPRASTTVRLIQYLLAGN